MQTSRGNHPRGDVPHLETKWSCTPGREFQPQYLRLSLNGPYQDFSAIRGNKARIFICLTYNGLPARPQGQTVFLWDIRKRLALRKRRRN
jgi:hypothetical protein